MKTLLTAEPGTGKSTILAKVRDSFQGEKYGIVAQEIRDEEGKRVGFESVNLDGESRVFMHISDIESDVVVGGKYKIDVNAINDFVVGEILKGKDNPNALVFIDEIGRAQSNSELFLDTIRDIFPSQTNFLGTIVYDNEPWADEFKDNDDVVLIVVTMENRDYLPAILTGVYKNVELYHRLSPMQQKYFRQRFRKHIVDENYTMAYKLFNNTLKYIVEDRVTEFMIEGIYFVKGNSNSHKVIFDSRFSRFVCDCDLYARRGEFQNETGIPTCSHIEAVKIYRGEFEG